MKGWPIEDLQGLLRPIVPCSLVWTDGTRTYSKKYDDLEHARISADLIKASVAIHSTVNSIACVIGTTVIWQEGKPWPDLELEITKLLLGT